MKFVLLIFQGESPLPGSDAWKRLPEEEQQAIYSDYAEINREPGLVTGLPLGLPHQAKTVRVQNGSVHTRNGTYQAEGAGGYMVLEAENMDAAIAIATRIPAARLGGAIEIRPAEQYW